MPPGHVSASGPQIVAMVRQGCKELATAADDAERESLHDRLHKHLWGLCSAFKSWEDVSFA